MHLDRSVHGPTLSHEIGHDISEHGARALARASRRGRAQHFSQKTGLAGEVAAAHQEAVDGMGGLPTLADRPYHQALTTPDIAGGKQLRVALDAVVTLVRVKPLEAAARNHGK